MVSAAETSAGSNEAYWAERNCISEAQPPSNELIRPRAPATIQLPRFLIANPLPRARSDLPAVNHKDFRETAQPGHGHYGGGDAAPAIHRSRGKCGIVRA